MHLLIVEDNEQLAQCLALELENEGFITETASNGAECLQRLQPDRTGEVGAFYWTVLAPDIVNSGREEQGLVSV